MTEILLSFVVLFGVTTLGLFYVNNHRQPLGSRYDDVYRLELGRPGDSSPTAEETANRLAHAIEDLPGVTGVAAAFTGPFNAAEPLLPRRRPALRLRAERGGTDSRKPSGSSC